MTTPIEMKKNVQNLRTLALVSRESRGPLPTLADVCIGIAAVGPASGPVLLECEGWSFNSSRPQLIMIQPRQNQFTQNQETNFPDQFATQVMATESDSITILISRVDPRGEGQGWAQDLELDIFVVE
jgi:hypothetical protein